MSDGKEAKAAIFAATSSFKEALGLLGKVDAKRLYALLNALLNALKAKSTLGEDIEAQAREALKVSQEELKTILAVSSYIFEQAAYHSLGPEALQKHLAAAGLASLPQQAFAKVWQDNGEGFLTALKGATFGTPQVLDSVSWRLQVGLGNDKLSKTKSLSAIFDLGLATAGDDSKEGRENLILEFSTEQLQSFYEQLEKVQTQLDALSKSSAA